MLVELPEVRSIVASSGGPVVTILGGVHGDEYEGVVAANAVAQLLAKNLIAGEVRVVSPAHPAAWASCTRESPIDGQNLARVFPGDAQGSPTQKVAFKITEQAIRGSDLLIDLHSAGNGFEMPFLCGFNSGADQSSLTSQHLAEVFCAKFTWLHDSVPAFGRSLTAAHDLSIPALYVEGHGGRSIRYSDFQGYLDGVRRVLYNLKMVKDAPHATYRTLHVRGDGNTDKGTVTRLDGYMITRVQVGDFVTMSSIIADMVNVHGASIGKVTAEHDGFVMLLRRDAHVTTGETVCIIAASNETM